MESDFYEDEIFYYKHRFPEEGIEIHWLTRLWGQERITFHGHEYKVPFEVSESFEGMTDEELRSYAAIIVPSAIVSDRLRYTEDVDQAAAGDRVPGPRVRREGRSSRGSSATACGSSPRCPSSSAAGRSSPTTTCTATSVNMGAIYTDQDVVVDGDLVTGRTGGHCHLFARAIIDMIAAKDDAAAKAGARPDHSARASKREGGVMTMAAIVGRGEQGRRSGACTTRRTRATSTSSTRSSPRTSRATAVRASRTSMARRSSRN